MQSNIGLDLHQYSIFFLSVLTIARKRLVQEGGSISIEIGGSVLTGSDVTRIFFRKLERKVHTSTKLLS